MVDCAAGNCERQDGKLSDTRIKLAAGVRLPRHHHPQHLDAIDNPKDHDMPVRIGLPAAAAAAAIALVAASSASAQILDLTFTGTTQGVFTEDPTAAPLGTYNYVASYLIDTAASPNYAPEGSTGFYYQGNDGSGYPSPIVSATFSFNGHSWTFPGAGNFGSATSLSYPPAAGASDTSADLEGDTLSLYNDYEGDPNGGAGQVTFPGNVPDEPFYSGILTPMAASVAQVAAVPEPATWGLMLFGTFAVGACLRRQRRRTASVYAPHPARRKSFGDLLRGFVVPRWAPV